jgi:hypothetical protein
MWTLKLFHARSSDTRVIHACDSCMSHTHVKTHKLLSTGCVHTACSQLVDKLSTACWQLATGLLSSTDLLQVVPTTWYQQFVNKLWVTTSGVLVGEATPPQLAILGGRKNEKGVRGADTALNFESGWEKHIWKNIVTSAKKRCVYRLINRLSA